jgi:hypothetical protein
MGARATIDDDFLGCRPSPMIKQCLAVIFSSVNLTMDDQVEDMDIHGMRNAEHPGR